jgi:hypothetical protein
LIEIQGKILIIYRSFIKKKNTRFEKDNSNIALIHFTDKENPEAMASIDDFGEYWIEINEGVFVGRGN